jgi:hypothetical protein
MDLYSFSPYVRYFRETPTYRVTPAYIDPDYIFTYIKDGSGVFLIEDLKYTVNKGDIVFMSPYLRHIITPIEPLTQYVIAFVQT